MMPWVFTTLVLARMATAVFICDDPDAKFSSTLTAGQYCAWMNKLNLLGMLPYIVATLYYLQACPVRSRVFARTSSLLPPPPCDPGIVGLQLLFHTSWQVFDRKYPSAVLGAIAVAPAATWPIALLVALFVPSKRSIILDTAGMIWTLMWFVGSLILLFPRLNWTMWSAPYLFKGTNPMTVFIARVRLGALGPGTPLLIKVIIFLLLILGFTLLIRPVDTGETTGVESVKYQGLKSDFPGEDRRPDFEEHSLDTTSFDRLVGRQVDSRPIDMTIPGYGFIVSATALLLVCTQRPVEDIQNMTRISALAALPRALFSTAVGCMVLGLRAVENRQKSTRMGICFVGLCCFSLALVGSTTQALG